MTQRSYASGMLFTQAHKAVRARVYALLETYGLSTSDWGILDITTQAPEGVRLAVIAKQMEVKAPLITMLASGLIEKGLILRIPHHTDGRAKLLVATAKGKKLAERIEGELSFEIARMMHGVSTEEAATFQKVLETILANAAQY